MPSISDSQVAIRHITISRLWRDLAIRRALFSYRKHGMATMVASRFSGFCYIVMFEHFAAGEDVELVIFGSEALQHWSVGVLKSNIILIRSYFCSPFLYRETLCERRITKNPEQQ
jgi:hypothetical protein